MWQHLQASVVQEKKAGRMWGKGWGHTGLKLATECFFATKNDFGEFFVGVYVQI